MKTHNVISNFGKNISIYKHFLRYTRYTLDNGSYELNKVRGSVAIRHATCTQFVYLIDRSSPLE